MDNYEDKQKENERKESRRRVYSTAVINQLISDKNQGYEIPYDAFFSRDMDLRNAGITFRMTPEEMEEYQKCYEDAEYFVDNYCRFMTDNGLSTVTLRDYQKKVIKEVTKERYIPEIGDYGPANQNLIWLASRQVGKCRKCLSINELDDVTSIKKLDSSCQPNKVFIEDKYYSRKKLTFIDRLIHRLSIIYRNL